MVEIERDNELKTFNTAKKYAEDVIFPFIKDIKKFQRQANFGHENLDNSIEINEEIRDIQRVNGLKAMAETQYDLLYEISSHVNIKDNKEENEKLLSLLETMKKVKHLFYYNREKFFNTIFKDTRTIEVRDIKHFEEVKDILLVVYANTLTLMTKNKLLFADAKDEFSSDEEINKEIMDRYIEG